MPSKFWISPLPHESKAITQMHTSVIPRNCNFKRNTSILLAVSVPVADFYIIVYFIHYTLFRVWVSILNVLLSTFQMI